MDNPSLYDDDILEWSEQQAAALRRAARTQPGISNEIDWSNVAEEIECVGRSEFAAVLSFVRLLLVHVIKVVSAPEASSVLHWRKEVVTFQRDLLDRITPSMHDRIDMDRLWQQARKQAEADLAVYGDKVAAFLPERCPFGLENVLDADFDLVATARMIRRKFSPD